MTYLLFSATIKWGMVENPIENQDLEAYRRVEQLLMEEALELKLPPEEARRQVQNFLQPVVAKSSSQEQALKKAA